jgi:hypothetical protein
MLMYHVCFFLHFERRRDETQNLCYGSERFRVTLKPKDKQYELQILKTTEEDLGVYVCEAQLNSE